MPIRNGCKMETHVALSAEKFDDRLLGLVAGVGLIRGEYVARRLGRYIPDPGCRRYLKAYLSYVSKAFEGRPVWYRFCDAPSNEINMLKGYDAYILEEFPTAGIRGMR